MPFLREANTNYYCQRKKETLNNLQIVNDFLEVSRRVKGNDVICKIHNNCCLLKFKQNLFVKFVIIVVCFKNKLFVKFVLIVAGLFSLRKILYRK